MLAFPLGAEFQINTTASSDEDSVVVAIDDTGDYVTTWRGYDGNRYGVFAQRFDSEGVPKGGEFLVNTSTTGNQYFPDVAVNGDGEFIITWMGSGPGDESQGVFARRFSASGIPLADQFLVNSITIGSESFPSVAMNTSGQFLITWSSQRQEGVGESGVRHYLCAQRFGADGAMQGSEFTIAGGAPEFFAISPQAAMRGDGNFVIAWSASAQTAGSVDIYARRYQASGNPLGESFRLDTAPVAQPKYLAIAMNAGGAFAVSWTSSLNDGTPVGVFARRFNPDGIADGPSFRVNTSPAIMEQAPSVGIDEDGSTVIAWTGHVDGQDDLGGILAQAYSSNGERVGEEFRVNTYTPSYQMGPSVAMTGAGRFVVVWSSEDQDGFRSGGYGQRFGIPSVTDNALLISGSPGNDRIRFHFDRDMLVVVDNGTPASYPATDISRIEVYANDGHDQVTIGPGVIGTYVLGGNGNDTLIGGDGNDSLVGASGKDSIDGGGGDDRVAGGKHGDILRGGAGNDRVYGDEAGDWMDGGLDRDRMYGGEGDDTILGSNHNDTIYGEGGNDSMDGGNHHDRIDGGLGSDTIFGQRGNDLIWGNDGAADLINGGADSDSAYVDLLDSVSLIEVLL